MSVYDIIGEIRRTVAGSEGNMLSSADARRIHAALDKLQRYTIELPGDRAFDVLVEDTHEAREMIQSLVSHGAEGAWSDRS